MGLNVVYCRQFKTINFKLIVLKPIFHNQSDKICIAKNVTTDRLE